MPVPLGPNPDPANWRQIRRMSNVIDDRVRSPFEASCCSERESGHRTQQRFMCIYPCPFPRNLLVEVAEHDGSLLSARNRQTFEHCEPFLVLLP